jgi:hypothetical protein
MKNALLETETAENTACIHIIITAMVVGVYFGVIHTSLLSIFHRKSSSV